MKTKKHMLIRWAQLVAGGVVLAASGAALAGVANTKHNLGSSGSGPNTFSGTTEICVFCHTPHGAETDAAAPLWNKTLPSNTYATYDDLGTSTLDGAVAAPNTVGLDKGSVSIACLSCHDGTQAMDVVSNTPGSGTDPAGFSAGGTWTGSSSPTGIALIGTDLTNDHPVSIQYGGGGVMVGAETGTLNDADFVQPSYDTFNGTTVWWVDTDATTGRQKQDMQLYTRQVAAIDGGTAQPFVECASCHDPHTENTTFLRIENTGSAVCLACHTK